MTSSLNVTQATLDDLDALAPLFDGYRVFYRRASDLPAAREFPARAAGPARIGDFHRAERTRRSTGIHAAVSVLLVGFRAPAVDPQRSVRRGIRARPRCGARPDGCSAQVRAANRRDPAGPADRARQRACASAVRVAGYVRSDGMYEYS